MTNAITMMEKYDDKYNDDDEKYLRVGHHSKVWRVKLVST